jgi:hypothetical protein
MAVRQIRNRQLHSLSGAKARTASRRMAAD